MSAQLSLLDLAREDPPPRKRVAAVSKAVFLELVATGKRDQRTHQVLTELAAYYERVRAWPTVNELAQWMFEQGVLPRPAATLIAPRLTELSRGLMDRKTRIYHGGGVIEATPARPCAVAKTKAHPWRIIEAGGRATRSFF